jgi:hypothetical protein
MLSGTTHNTSTQGTDEMIEESLYVCNTTVIDPDTKLPVEMEIRKCQESGAMIGIDGSFLEYTGEMIRNPYNYGHIAVEGDELSAKITSPLKDAINALQDLLKLVEENNKEYLENTHDFIGEQPCAGCPVCKAREVLKTN